MAAQEGELVVDTNKHTLAPNTLVIVNITGVHYNERHWPHPHIIEPRRWLTSHPNVYDPLAPTPQQEEEIRQSRAPIPSHIRGTFMTFNEGPRSCPGRRFAQVEFIAFFSRLLRGNRLNLGGSVSAAEAERQIRLRAGGSPVTLVPPEDVKVYLTPIAQ
jgi:cytochrome P450